MKVISLNIERRKHVTLVHDFLRHESGDVVCLMEAPDDMVIWLEENGYYCSFARMSIINNDEGTYFQGVLIASKVPHTAEVLHYYTPSPEIIVFDERNKRGTQRQLVLFANVDGLNIGATHFTWNPEGETADEYQTTDLQNMLAVLADKPPHILCGDLNIPRNCNVLYKELCAHYTDNIPFESQSSLDRNLHRHGNNSKLEKMFNNFMVDYMFTKEPLKVYDTKLVFGVSDHAAVVTTINL